MKPRLRWADHFGPKDDIFAIVRIHAYQVGLAEGELRGRLMLAQELESEFPDHRDGISKDDAYRIRMRQVH